MAQLQDKEPNVPGAPQPGNIPLPPIVGPKLPNQMPDGYSGKARFDWMVANRPAFAGQPDLHDYNQWILSLQADPNDPEFTALLRQAQAKAYRNENDPLAGQISTAAPPKPGQLQASVKFIKKPPATQPDVTTAGMPPTAPTAPKKVTAPPDTVERDIANTKRQLGIQRQYGNTPLIKGMDIAEADIFEQGGGGLLADFVKNHELQLSGTQGQMAIYSGDYVYTGKTTQTIGGYKVDRDTYVFAKDADAAIVDLGADAIKAYQKKLGLLPTGVVDPALASLWHNAVEIAQIYTKAGKKVDLKFIFDQLVAGQVAGVAGGGGGGGRRFIGETPEEIVGIDYYRAMMDVLGDISGVGSGA